MTPIPYIGQGSIGRSEFINSERLVNLYPQADPTGKATIALYNCPGLDRLRTLGSGPSRAAMEENGLLYILSGERFYSVNTSYVASIKGTVNSGTGHASMSTNGLVILIVDGTQAWAYTIASDTFAQVTDADLPATPVSTVVMDNTFVVVEGGSQRFYTSTDGTTWDPLQVASAETFPDDLIGAIADHQELILFGKKSTEIWYNSGQTFTFSRRSVLENGCLSAGTIAKLDNRVFWLDTNGIVRGMTGYTDQRVSTHSQETRIQSHTLAEREAAIGFTSAENGHMFYHLSVGNETFVYDVSANKWHERRYLVPSTGELTRHRANWCVAFNGINVVGDYENGKIYDYNADHFTDEGDPIQAIGTYRHISANGKAVRFNAIEIEVESGVGSLTGQGKTPSIELRFSRNGGKTWSPWYARTIGVTGNYRAYPRWAGLGTTKDMVTEFRITDPVKRVIANANIYATVARA